MPEGQKEGKIILINGPPFSGKTGLVIQLLKAIPEAKVVNSELFWEKKSQKLNPIKNFHNYVKELSKDNIVIGETITSCIGQKDVFDLDNYMTIIAIPDKYEYFESHAKATLKMTKQLKYGRANEPYYKYIERNYIPENSNHNIIYNRKNLDYVVKEVLKYCDNR